MCCALCLTGRGPRGKERGWCVRARARAGGRAGGRCVTPVETVSVSIKTVSVSMPVSVKTCLITCV